MVSIIKSRNFPHNFIANMCTLQQLSCLHVYLLWRPCFCSSNSASLVAKGYEALRNLCRPLLASRASLASFVLRMALEVRTCDHLFLLPPPLPCNRLHHHYIIVFDHVIHVTWQYILLKCIMASNCHCEISAAYKYRVCKKWCVLTILYESPSRESGSHDPHSGRHMTVMCTCMACLLSLQPELERDRDVSSCPSPPRDCLLTRPARTECCS